MKQIRVIATLFAIFLCSVVACGQVYAPVQVLAWDFNDFALPNFKVVLLETNQTWITGPQGFFTANFPVGSNVTFFAPETTWHHATQASTITVPPEGLVSRLTQVVLQIPLKIVFDLMALVSPGKKDLTKCQGVVTVSAFNKTVKHVPQGIEGAVVHVDPPLYSMLFYFGIKANNHTDPLPNNLTSTSLDGGVMIQNMEVGHVYTVTATKAGYDFTATVFQCYTTGQFLNAPPNLGPRANRP